MVTNDTGKNEEDEARQVPSFVRTAVAGHPQGAMRRIILYTVVFVALGVSPAGLVGGAVIGIAALTLLALTDQLV